MPSRSLRPCAHPGCPQLARGSRCEKHQQTKKLEDREQRAAYDKTRPNFRQRGYTSRWDKFRLWYLRANPLCVECAHPAREVDHKIPLTGPNDPSFFDPEAVQSMCRPCHSSKTQRDRAMGLTRLTNG